ncbi:hypothetical protein GCM10022407_11150 [Hymenobacter antarcticus]|uniref:Uncharacterized protein n=1 Tax=Hymenobacter antarcticus TaxID=486270 RepID=A0ABP7PJU9_9BACT
MQGLQHGRGGIIVGKNGHGLAALGQAGGGQAQGRELQVKLVAALRGLQQKGVFVLMGAKNCNLHTMN